MKLLILTEQKSDLTAVLESCGVETVRMTQKEAWEAELSDFDAYCVLLPGQALDARFRERLELETAKGKRIFTEAIASWLDVYCEPGRNTVRSRLIYLEPENGEGIPGFETGDLLDDESNVMNQPYFTQRDTVPLLVYQDYIIAHTHTNMNREEIRKDSRMGLWTCCKDTVMMSSFRLHNFSKARFAPRQSWVKLITYIAEWLTGRKPARIPESAVRFGTEADLADPAVFEKCRQKSIEKGLHWLEQFLVEKGCGGIREGLQHDIDPEGNQVVLNLVRNDCSGESAGAFKMYAYLHGREDYAEIGKNLDSFIYGPMVVKGGLFDGMMHWTEEAWGVCYQDDVARAILPTLQECVLFGKEEYFPVIRRALDFLIKTTAKNGNRVARTDRVFLDEKAIEELAGQEKGLLSAHYNAYYHAVLLLAYKYCKEPRYLEVGQKGLESLMSQYPELTREQSETQEMCRLILPLAVLYEVTGEEKHREMLYRVARDLQKVRHPFGGYMEWDTEYKAVMNRNSKGECSILTENGDPVADLLYSCNFLSLGFAWAYLATSDEWFHDLWKDMVKFYLRTQISSENPLTDGSWCRAFDMNLKEAYAAPHDSGWATYCSETGWTCAEILMGMMFLDVAEKCKEETKHE